MSNSKKCGKNAKLTIISKSTNNGTFTPTNRRLRSDDSSPDTSTPAYKKQNQTLSPHHQFAQLYGLEDPDSAPAYALQLMAMQTQTAESLAHLIEDVSSIKESINFVIDETKDAMKKANEVESKVNELSKQMNSMCSQMNKLSAENRELRAKINHQEAYSRRSNLIISGIPEERREGDVLHKVYRVMANMGHPNPQSVPIVKAHRLGPVRRDGPGAPRPRDVIVRFERMCDRDEMLQYKHHLRGTSLLINEDLPTEMQEDREMLLPILHAAKKIPEFRSSKLVQDKLIINNRVFTPTNLHELPSALHPTKISSRENEQTFVWFSRLSPLSNFAPFPINIEGTTYSCNEQYIQSKKAELAGDAQAARRIMEEKVPRRMKAIGGSVKVNQGTWDGQLLGILKACNWAKYTQNSEPLKYLLSTGQKTLGEAKPKGAAGIGLPLHHCDVLNTNAWKHDNLMEQYLTEIREQKK